LDKCGLGACVRLAGTKVARQPQLELAVAPRLLRVPAEMIAEQPLVAGRPGGLGHHVQVMGAGAVTVAALEEQSVRHARVDQLVAEAVEDGSGGKPVLQALDAGHHVDDRLGGKPRHRRAADVLQPQEPGADGGEDLGAGPTQTVRARRRRRPTTAIGKPPLSTGSC
jgi:hypothetical protein